MSGIVALIPARGGSKRLPGKNLKTFAGHPLLAHSIAAAQAATQIDRCYVSSDDPEILDVAARYGADPICRPAEFASDTATTASVAVHLLRELDRQNVPARIVVTLQPTCPLRPRSLIADAIRLFQEHESSTDSVIGVTSTERKLGVIREGLFVPEYRPGTRSQDLPHRYFENGLVYVTGGALLRERQELFGTRIRALATEAMYAMGDVDTELDFEIAEFLYVRHRDHFPYSPSCR